MWGCFGGEITKTPPHLSFTPAIPREPLWLLSPFNNQSDQVISHHEISFTTGDENRFSDQEISVVGFLTFR
jgi:hypothetical protein